MLTKKEIKNYHLSNIGDNIRGFEFEIFCLNSKYERLFLNENKKIGLQDILNYLINNKGYKNLDSGKTIGVEKRGAKFTLEPGCQLEYAAKPSKSIEALIKEYLKLIKEYQVLEKKLDLKFIDISLFPLDENSRKIPLLPAARYKIMEKYLKNTGTLGTTMMKGTASLQITFSYKNQKDLEKKVNRLLFLKPILLVLSSNSRVYRGKDSKYHSFREVVWKNTDPNRCGDPGKNFWTKGRWTMKNYIEKVLDAPLIFDAIKKQYQTIPAKPFRNSIKNFDLESYIFHNSTIFTDIRIKNYIEIRYMDNPNILLTPGMILLIDNILNQESAWKVLNKSMPYKFKEVPMMTEKLNKISIKSTRFWNKNINPVLVKVINKVKQKHSKKIGFLFDALIEKTNKIGEENNIEIDPSNTLENSVNQFYNNLIKLLTI